MKFAKILFPAVMAAGLAATGAQAQVDVMIPAGPGGGWDGTGRQAFQAMNDAGIYTEGVNYTNTGGAGGTVGLAEFLSTHTGDPDALAVFGAVTVGAIALNNSPIDLTEFRPVARLTADYAVLAVSADSDIETLEDFVAQLSEDPGGTPVGGGSAGGTDQIALALLAQEAGISVPDLNYIPQTSGAETVTAIVNGTLTAGISGVSEFAQFDEQGRIRILGITSAERLPLIEDVPTFTEAGYPVELANWRGILAAPDAPEENTQTWIDRFTEMSESEEWQQVLETQGWEDFFLAGDEFGEFIANEIDTQEQILRDAGLVD